MEKDGTVINYKESKFLQIRKSNDDILVAQLCILFTL